MRNVLTVGQRGAITIPKAIRERIGLEEGAILVFELTDNGILLRPAVPTPVTPEKYTTLRQAEFLLNNAVDPEDYQRARTEVEAMGLNPDDVPHEKP